MKNITEYILEQENKVWVIKDKDLDGAIFDVCDSKKAAEDALAVHMKENPDNHMEIVSMNRSEVEKTN